MAFNRQKYDDCNERDSLKMSKGLSDYVLRPPISDQPCIPNTPLIIMQRAGDSIERGPRVPYNGPINVDSELRGVGRKASRCQATKYIPKCDSCGAMNNELSTSSGYCAFCKAILGRGWPIDWGTCAFPVDCTRASNPVGTLRGININRFNPLCHNPQQNVFFPGQYQIDTRTVMKDNHRPCIPVPKVNGMIPSSQPRL